MHLHACQCHQLEWNKRNKTQTHTKIKLKMSTIFQAKDDFMAKHFPSMIASSSTRYSLDSLYIHLRITNEIKHFHVHDKKHDRESGGRRHDSQMEINFCSCQATGWFFAHFIRLPIDEELLREPKMHLPLTSGSLLQRI